MRHRLSWHRTPLRWLALSAVLMVATCGVEFTVTGQGPKSASINSPALSANEQKVLHYLESDWDAGFVTSVDLAMAAVGSPSSDALRFGVGSYIKSHPGFHYVIDHSGWTTLVLTPDEKLLARALINAARDRQPTPSLADLAKAVGISKNKAQRGLEMLRRFEIVKPDAGAGGVAYTVEAKYINWDSRPDFTFHTLTLSDGRRLNAT